MSPSSITQRPVLAANTATLTIAVATAVAGIGLYAVLAKRGPRSAQAAQAKGAFSGFGFRSLPLQSSGMVSHDTKRLRFGLPDPSLASGLPLTASLLSVSFPGGIWPVIRPYTPVTSPDAKGYIELFVKRYPDGKQSSHLHSLKPGDKVTFTSIKGYQWTLNKHPHVALIAGGAGITPAYQLLRGILANPEDTTRITLVWGVNSDEDLFLREELADMERRFPGRLKSVFTVSNPAPGSPYLAGRVTRQVLEHAGLGEGRDRDVKLLVCGPPPMEKALTGSSGFMGRPRGGVLAEMGFTPGQIHIF